MQGSNQVRRTSKATSFIDRNLHFPRQVHKSKSLNIETFIVQLKSPSLYQSHKSKKALPESTMTVMNKWVCYNLRTWLRTELSRLNYKLCWRELDRGKCWAIHGGCEETPGAEATSMAESRELKHPWDLLMLISPSSLPFISWLFSLLFLLSKFQLCVVLRW